MVWVSMADCYLKGKFSVWLSHLSKQVVEMDKMYLITHYLDQSIYYFLKETCIWAANDWAQSYKGLLGL